MCVLLVAAPLLVTWAMGLYDALLRRQVRHELRQVTADLLDAWPSQEPGAEVPTRWLSSFAKERGTYLRVLDREGDVVVDTDPVYGEGRISEPGGWLSDIADFFYGPEGPPNLRLYEASLAPVRERPEVAAALAGKASDRAREPPSTTHFAFYRAVPVPETGQVLYIARLSRRSVRGLYDLRYQLLKLSLFLLVVAAVTGIFLSRNIARPIAEMQSAVRSHLETGSAAPIALDRKDEIGDLSRDFAELAHRLQEQRTETAKVAADLAHDLKSPLSTISTSAEILESDAPLNRAKRGRMVEALQLSVTRMRRSVDALLALARLDEEMATQPRERVDLSAMMRQIRTELAADPAHGALTFSVDTDAQAPAEVVPIRFEELLRNLVANAAAFARSRVELSLHARGASYELAVSDDGPGVSPGNRDKIFSRFFSARPEGSEAGTGLGLTIAQTIATAHGGRVVLDPAEDGRGARFVVRFPISSGSLP